MPTTTGGGKERGDRGDGARRPCASSVSVSWRRAGPPARSHLPGLYLQARASVAGRSLDVSRPRGLPLLKRAISEKLAPMGVNVLIVEVNYGFAFRSHPELSGGGDNALLSKTRVTWRRPARNTTSASSPCSTAWGTSRGRGQHFHSWPNIPSSTSRPRSPRTTRGSTAGAGARSTPMSTRSSSP